jgi:hypothetical protein
MHLSPTPLRLNFAIIPVLKQIISKYPVFTVDGTVFDAGVGMMMSCRGICGKCLQIRYEPPVSGEIANYSEFKTYQTFGDKIDDLPPGMKVYIHNDVLNEIEKDEVGNLLETVDFIIINMNNDPPLIYAQIM